MSARCLLCTAALAHKGAPCSRCTAPHTTADALDDCDLCDDGLREYSTDHLDHRGDHYTREHYEPCTCVRGLLAAARAA